MFSATIHVNRVTEKQVKKASKRSLNKTALWIKNQSVKEISNQKKIQQKIIRERINIIKARYSKALIIAKFYAVKAFGTRFTTKAFKGSFIATMPTGHKGIFQRKGVPRLPIREVFLPFGPVFAKIVKSIIDKSAEDKFSQYFHDEISKL